MLVVSNPSYIRHGVVALETDRTQTFLLLRKDELDQHTGKVIPGNECWRLQSPTGPIVIAIDQETKRFRGEGGLIFRLEYP